MQFKPSYLLGLNEIVGLTYIENLLLLIKRTPFALCLVRELNASRFSVIMGQRDKTCKTIVLVCKAHYCNCILNKLGINSTFGNRTYTAKALLKNLEILQNHVSISFTKYIHNSCKCNRLIYFTIPILDTKASQKPLHTNIHCWI